MSRRWAAFVAAVVLLVLSTTLVNRVLPGWAYPVSGVVTTVGLLGLAHWSGLRAAALGLDRTHLRRAGLFGLIGLGVIALGFTIALAVPVLRTFFHDGRMHDLAVGPLLWAVLIRIPFGTVLLEEVAFRGVLPALLGGGDRWRWGPVLGASALFGLWHVLPSLALTSNAAMGAVFGGASLVLVSAAVMLATAVAGVFLLWWRHTGKGVLAPAMVHLATNSGGVLIAWYVLSSV